MNQPTMGWYHWNQQYLWFTMGILWDDVFFFTNINQQYDEWDIAVIMGMLLLLMMMIMLIMMVIIKDPPFTTIGQ
jgi:hypothetical protein